MAKLISELGADVIDDTIVEKKSRLTPKQKRYAFGIPSLVAGILAIATVYVLAANVWLIDYENMAYITYSYSSIPNENGELTASIKRVFPDSGYPSDFRVPSSINGYKITTIDKEAFAGCDRLTKIRMPNTITTIGDEAFAGCTELATFEFSKNITHIGKEAFLDTAFEANLPNDAVVSVNSVLVHIGQGMLGDKTALITKVGNYEERITNYIEAGYTVFDMDSLNTISNLNDIVESSTTITQWMEGLFNGSDSIEIIEIPNDLSEVPSRSFEDCQKVKEVIIYDNITSIGDKAFYNCVNLEKIDIPDNVVNIGNYAFSGVGAKFDGLPETITSIGEGVFSNCDGITTFTYPSSLKTVPNFTFDGCVNLENVNFADIKSITKFGEAAFRNTSLTEFFIPKNVAVVSESLFENCTKLETVYFYENVNNEYYEVKTDTYDDEGNPITVTEKVYYGVESIYGKVFKGCSSLDSILLTDEDKNVLSSCTETNGTFYFPRTLTAASISVTPSEYDSFNGTAVSKVILPESLGSIGIRAFANCANLEEVSFGNIASSKVQIIEDYAFENCVKLPTFTCPDVVYSVGMGVFKGCTNLTSVHLPEAKNVVGGATQTLSVIKENLFEGCTSLKDVNVPSTVTKISDNSFLNCSGLEKIFVPKKCATITKTSFKGCVNLTVYTDATSKLTKWATGYDADLQGVVFSTSYEDYESL